MNVCRSQRWAATLLMFVAGGALLGCSGRKQVPFGLKDAGPDASEATGAAGDEESPAELPVGQVLSLIHI